MAAEFSRTRDGLPQDLLDLGSYILKGEKALDLGCGNGRFSELFDAADYTGADTSEELLKIARRNHPAKEFVLVEPLKLPFPDNAFDKIFCLAVIHHLPSQAYRRAFLREIARVLKPGGRLVLTAWYLLQKPKVWGMLTKLAVLKLVGRNRLDPGDSWVPFSSADGKVLAQRYIHVFSATGLRMLVACQSFRIESVRLVKRGKNRNIEVVAIKAN